MIVALSTISFLLAYVSALTITALGGMFSEKSGTMALALEGCMTFGAFIAGISRSRFHAVVAMGCSLLAAFRAIAALLSVFGILPLPECPFPLLTSSLPDLCAGMVLPGLLCGISGRAAAELEDDARLAMLAH